MSAKMRSAFLILASISIAAPALAAGEPTSAPASAQVQPSSFDISGVKLGMTADEAFAALKQFDRTMEVKKRYTTDKLYFFAQLGTDDPAPERKSLAYLVAIVAEGPHRSPYDDKDEIDVILSPVPGQERVIAVIREKKYPENQPTIAQLKQGLLAKQPSATTASHEKAFPDGRYEITWLFDVRGRLLPPATVTKQQLDILPLIIGALPSGAHEGGSTGFGASFWPAEANHALAQEMRISLYDETLLYRSIAQAKETFGKLDAAKKAAEARDAAKNAGATKF